MALTSATDSSVWYCTATTSQDLQPTTNQQAAASCRPSSIWTFRITHTHSMEADVGHSHSHPGGVQHHMQPDRHASHDHNNSIIILQPAGQLYNILLSSLGGAHHQQQNQSFPGPHEITSLAPGKPSQLSPSPARQHQQRGMALKSFGNPRHHSRLHHTHLESRQHGSGHH